MNDSVPAACISKANKCTHGHSCLETRKCGDRDLCEVKYADGQDVLFLCDIAHAECPYRVSFAEGYMCRCPVHYWLHTNKIA